MEIVVASGNSAVPLVVAELGGVDMGGEDVGIAVGDVVGLELIVGFDEGELLSPAWLHLCSWSEVSMAFGTVIVSVRVLEPGAVKSGISY